MHPYNHPSLSSVPQYQHRPLSAERHQHHVPHHHPVDPMPPTLPPSPASSHPPALTPGSRPASQHRPDLFFQHRSYPMTSPPPMQQSFSVSHQPTYNNEHMHPHPYHAHRSYTAPPKPPKPHQRSSVPVLPPKIPLYPESIPNSTRPKSTPNTPRLPPQVPPLPSTSSPPIVTTDLHSLPELSPESSPKRTQLEVLNQEEEELAKAMQDSVLSAGPSIHEFVTSEAERISPSPLSENVDPGHQPWVAPTASTDTITTAEDTTALVTLALPKDYLAQIEADEALARQLAAEDDDQRAPQPSQEEDEAFARRLAAEEEALEEPHNSKASEASHDSEIFQDGLPTYADVTSPVPGPSASPTDSRSSFITSPEMEAELQRKGSTGSSNRWSASDHTHSTDSSKRGSIAPSKSSNGTQSEESSNSNGRPPGAPINANQFVDAELLTGVSLNFVAPVITMRLAPMQGPMPNIISLPYGRCPPLHVQAPNWRHLLKLLARLSATRIEPTVEAVAVTKTELKLRTVIQFVRTHHQSSDWRTILWLTIDHPVPPSLPGAFKYTNGDVNTLPFSYTLSSVPALLRDSAETHMSRAYTVPATSNIPYPTLPITFPSLAMYLQAVLDESRRYINDSSSGVRKLAKMMDLCYPTKHAESAYYPPEQPAGMGGLFKRVIGRGNRNSKKARGLNEDTFEFITPFVPDEWGS